MESQRERAAREKRRLIRLTEQERDLYKDLAALEGRINRLENELWQSEAELERIVSEQKKTMALYDGLVRRRAATIADLNKLLAALWPLHLENRANLLSGLSSWAGADRRFTWLGRVYARAGDKLAELAEQTSALAANLARQDMLKQKVEKSLQAIEAQKDELLAAKLELVGSIRKVRAELVSREQELNDVLETIDSLNYRIKAMTSRRFSDLKGALPWPAKGRLVEDYAPDASPPVRGVGLELEPGEQVRSVFWGKVVHNDLLRGFGKVIIVSHGQNYYSLYAFLSESLVRNGQEIEKDETIGVAGYYPEAQGPGLYFELRFHQKAINPLKWLQALNGREP